MTSAGKILTFLYPYHWVGTEGMLVRAYVIAFLRMAFSHGSDVVSLLSNDALRLMPVSLPKDGFAIKPGFQVDQNTMLIVGGREHYSLDYVKQQKEIPHDYFSDKFVTEVQIMGVTSLDNKAALIIGNDFVGSGGDGNSMLQFHLKRLQELQQCLHCLQDTSDLLIKEECSTTECPQCVSLLKKFAMSVKKRGSNTGAQRWEGVITAWRKVFNALEPCVSILPLTVRRSSKQPLNSCKKTKAMESQTHTAL